MREQLRSIAVPEAIVGLLAVVVLILWATDGGGAAPSSWYPGALFLLGLLVVALIAFTLGGGLGGIPKPTLWAIVLLGLYAAWTLLSIAWADSRDDAWDGGNRAFLYLILFALFAIPRWSLAGAAFTFGAYALGIAGVAAATLIDLSSAADPALSFIAGSLSDPTGYHNATAALFLVAVLPAAFLAARRETPWFLRGLLLAAAGLLAAMSIPAQSRGAAIVLPIALIVYLAVTPNRVRALLWLIPVAAGLVFVAPPLLDIYDVVVNGGDISGAIGDAASRVWIMAGALLVAGTAAAFADSRAEPSPALSLWSGRVLAAGAGVAAVVALVVALGATGNPADWAKDRWDDFKSGYTEQQFGTNRFTGSLGSNRYDFWRVGMDEFADHPITGVGADNFEIDYLRDRRADEEPKHPHSLEVRVIAQGGLVGAGLFTGFLVLAFWAAGAARARTDSRYAAGLAATAIATAVYWLGHATGDWLWVFPAVTGPALMLLALAGRLGPEAGLSDYLADPAHTGGIRGRSPWFWFASAVGAAAVIVVAISMLLPFRAEHEVASASAVWREDPEAAFAKLDEAGDLNFLSDQPYVIAGAIAERIGDLARMRAEFERALDRDPQNWYSLLELGALEAVEGNREESLELLGQASELNPREPLIAEVIADVRAGRKVSLEALDRALLDRVCARIGRTTATAFCD